MEVNVSSSMLRWPTFYISGEPLGTGFYAALGICYGISGVHTSQMKATCRFDMSNYQVTRKVAGGASGEKKLHTKPPGRSLNGFLTHEMQK